MNSPGALPFKRQRLRQLFRAVIGLGMGVGLVADPVLFPASAQPARSRTGSRSVQADGSSGSPGTAAPDLLLQKSGEKMADALAAFSEGLAAEEDADTERAMEAYRRSLALDPGNTELAVKIAFELARRGDVPAGIDLLKDAAKASPKDALPPLCLSQLYGKFLKKPQLAEKYALSALSLDPDNFAPYLALFDLYLTDGQKKKANAILERASKSDSTDPQFWLQLAEVHSRLALKEEKEEGQNGQESEPVSSAELTQITTVLQKALAYSKDDPDVLAKAADLYVLTKQVAAAIPLYRKIVDQSREPNSEPLLAIRFKLARALLASGERNQAIAILEQLVKDSPTRYETYELLGELYATEGQLERATASYQQALLIDSTEPKNYLRIADLQLQQKKPDEAAATLEESRSRFPGIPELTYSLAIALSQGKQHAKALGAFAEAQHEAENSNAALLDGRFYFNYGTVAEQAGDLAKAAELLRKSIQLDPSNAAEAYNYLGYMWADKGMNLEEATELIKRALALDPENGAYLDSLGWCYYKLGNYELALVNLQRAVERLQPEDPIVFEHLGDIHQAMGNMPQAVATWKKALAMDPGNKPLAGKIDAAQRKLTAAPPPPAPPAPAQP